MSPARRLLLSAVGVVVVVVLLAAALAAVLRRDDRAAAAPAVAQDVPGPVVLVPGYGGSTASLEVLAGRLRAAGREATVVRLPGDGTGDLAAVVPVLDAVVQQALAGGAPSVDVVGYSAGGVVARLWERAGGAAVTRRVVTLGSPHHGTGVAGLAARYAPAACPTACQQLAPGSDLLDRLNRGDETPEGPVWLSLWTTSDTVVTPPDSARLDGATDLVLQQLCTGATTSHSDLPRDPKVQAVVLAALAAGTLDVPQSCPA